jgi:hypothetical protein
VARDTGGDATAAAVRSFGRVGERALGCRGHGDECASRTASDRHEFVRLAAACRLGIGSRSPRRGRLWSSRAPWGRSPAHPASRRSARHGRTGCSRNVVRVPVAMPERHDFAQRPGLRPGRARSEARLPAVSRVRQRDLSSRRWHLATGTRRGPAVRPEPAPPPVPRRLAQLPAHPGSLVAGRLHMAPG